MFSQQHLFMESAFILQVKRKTRRTMKMILRAAQSGQLKMMTMTKR